MGPRAALGGEQRAALQQALVPEHPAPADALSDGGGAGDGRRRLEAARRRARLLRARALRDLSRAIGDSTGVSVPFGPTAHVRRRVTVTPEKLSCAYCTRCASWLPESRCGSELGRHIHELEAVIVPGEVTQDLGISGRREQRDLRLVDHVEAGVSESWDSVSVEVGEYRPSKRPIRPPAFGHEGDSAPRRSHGVDLLAAPLLAPAEPGELGAGWELLGSKRDGRLAVREAAEQPGLADPSPAGQGYRAALGAVPAGIEPLRLAVSIEEPTDERPRGRYPRTASSWVALDAWQADAEVLAACGPSEVWLAC